MDRARPAFITTIDGLVHRIGARKNFSQLKFWNHEKIVRRPYSAFVSDTVNVEVGDIGTDSHVPIYVDVEVHSPLVVLNSAYKSKVTSSTDAGANICSCACENGA